MPRPELLYAFKLASSWPFLIFSFLSTPKIHGSVGPVATRNAPFSISTVCLARPLPHCSSWGPGLPCQPLSPVKVILYTRVWQTAAQAISGPLPLLEVKFWWNGAMSIHLHDVYSCFYSPLAK